MLVAALICFKGTWAPVEGHQVFEIKPTTSQLLSIELKPAKMLKGSNDAISSFAFSLECYKLVVHRYVP